MKLGLYDRLHMRHRLWRYRFTSEEWHNISFLLRAGVPGTTMLDIGANRGVYSYYMSRKAGPSGEVFAFEAQPELGPHLNALKETYRLDNLTVVNKGLSSSPATLTMLRTKAGASACSFHDISEKNYEKIEAEVITLDDYLSTIEHGSISFIKCDVERHELDVFRGAEKTLKQFMPTLLFEGHHKFVAESGLFDYLVDLGFDGFFFFIDPADHARFIRKRSGRFVHFSEFENYPYIRPGCIHRDYIFMKKGLRPPYESL
jgi:FkbM family methyltransferase